MSHTTENTKHFKNPDFVIISFPATGGVLVEISRCMKEGYRKEEFYIPELYDQDAFGIKSSLLGNPELKAQLTSDSRIVLPEVDFTLFCVDDQTAFQPHCQCLHLYGGGDVIWTFSAPAIYRKYLFIPQMFFIMLNEDTP